MNEFLLLVLLVATILVTLAAGVILFWRAGPSPFVRRFLFVLLAMELTLALAQPGILSTAPAPLLWHLYLGGEYRLVVAMAAAQLCMAGAASLLYAARLKWSDRDGRLAAPGYRLYWLVMGVGLLFLALDEFFVIHETNDELWRLIYLLGGLLIGLPAVLLLLGGGGKRREYALLLAGLAIMGVSALLLDDVLDKLFLFGFGCAGPDWLSALCQSVSRPAWAVVEEVSELLGVTLALGALLLLAQGRLSPRRRGPGRLAFWTRASLLVPLCGALVVAAYATWLWLTPALQLALQAERVQLEYMDGDLALLGYRLEGAPASPGARVEAHLYWQARRPLPRPNMLVSLHVLAGPDFKTIEQDDDAQLGTLLPSTAFVPGTIVHKVMGLDLPPDAPLGHHPLMLRVWTGEKPWTVTTGIDVSHTDRQLLAPDMVLFAGLDVVGEG